MIEDDILNGTYQEDEQIISVAQFASTFQINPATIVRGVGLLVNGGILYKKRGLGMYVTVGAKEVIMNKRRERFNKETIQNMLSEADKLELTTEDVIKMV